VRKSPVCCSGGRKTLWNYSDWEILFQHC